MIKKVGHVKWANVIVFIFIVMYMLRYFTKINIRVSSVGMALTGCVAFFAVFAKHMTEWKLFVGFLAIDIIGTLGIIINRNFGIIYIFLVLAYQGIGLLLAYYPSALRIVSSTYPVLCAYLLIQLVLFGKSGDELITLSSKNYISILIITIVGCRTIYFHTQGISLRYIDYVLALLISIIVDGRGGMISCMILLLGITFIKLRKNKPLLVLAMMGVLALVAILALIRPDILESASAKFLHDESRFYQWTTYLRNSFSNFKYLLFGTPLSSDYYLNTYRNLHNTFLNVHLFYGLLPFFAVIALCTCILSASIKTKYQVLFPLALCMVVRSVTDATSFSDCFDLVWYLLFVIEVWNERRKKEDDIVHSRKSISINECLTNTKTLFSK